MKTFLVSTAAVLSLLATPSWAANRTVTLDVPGMTCPVCPITVKKALTKVVGVGKVDVNFEHKQAVVSFDDTRINVGALTQATEDAGYPSSVLETRK